MFVFNIDMKADKVSFGQTFLHKSYYKYLPKETMEKLEYSYGLAELFPVDMLLGATKKGDLTLKIGACNAWDYLNINNFISSPQNISFYLFMKALENTGRLIHGKSFPLQSYEIKNPQSMTQEGLSYVIRDKIVSYIEKNNLYN